MLEVCKLFVYKTKYRSEIVQDTADDAAEPGVAAGIRVCALPSAIANLSLSVGASAKRSMFILRSNDQVSID